MKYLYVLLFLMCFCQHIFSQTSTSYLEQVNLAKMQFYQMGDFENISNKRSIQCDFRTNICKPDAVVDVKKGIEIWYEVTPLNDKNKPLPEDFLAMSFSIMRQAAIHTENDKDLPIDSEVVTNLKTLQSADWAEISTFKVKNDINKCLKKEFCTYLLMYKKGSGYASILIFYTKDTQNEVEQGLKTLLSSLHF